MFKDNLGREFKTLRISLTAKCNLACIYCVGATEPARIPPNTHPGVNLTDSNKINSPKVKPEEYASIAKRIHEVVTLKKIRLTGGEPLLYNDICKVISKLKAFSDVKVHLTSNGTLLNKQISRLKNSGLDSINVSVDALDPEICGRINGKNKIKETLAGIEKSIQIGMPVKINCTVLRGYNDNEILPLFEYFSKKGIVVRFLELMKMGPMNKNHSKYFFPQNEIIKIIAKKYRLKEIERKKSSTSRYWKTADARVFGIIANESSSFCSDCNRLRLDSQGNIYGCLSAAKSFNVKKPELSREKFTGILKAALGQKQQQRFNGSRLSMIEIGG